jgi:potassium-transporting ATPase ATP-binding subunit
MATATAPPQERKERKPEIRQEGTQLLSKGMRSRPLFDPEILKRAIKESFVKLDPRLVAKNPVMFVVEVGAALTTVFVIKDAVTGVGGLLFGVQIVMAMVHCRLRQFR